jgi:hypothetical protein
VNEAGLWGAVRMLQDIWETMRMVQDILGLWEQCRTFRGPWELGHSTAFFRCQLPEHCREAETWRCSCAEDENRHGR